MSDSEDDIPLSRRTESRVKQQTVPPHLSVPAPIDDSTPDPSQARTAATIEDEDSDDDIPLTQRKNLTKNNGKMQESDSDDDIPLAKRTTSTTKRVVKEESSDDDIPLSKKQKKVSKPTKSKTLKRSSSVKIESNVANKKIKKEIKEEVEVYKWWEEETPDRSIDNEEDEGGIRWTTLSHYGVLFPPEYVPHGIQMKYDGKPVSLTPEAEEVASFFAALLESDHGKNPTFQKNFFSDFKKVLAKSPKNPKIESFEKCDFRPIWQKFELDKERKKQMTKEEKLKIKDERTKMEEPYLYATIDGRKEKIGNFRIEPPGLFRGRGDHPKTGRLKLRVYPEQVTLNLSKDSPIPPTLPGHKWGKIVHDQQATWLATWKENINDTSKYVFLAANSSWKGQSDMKKFDKARELKHHVDRIRASYTADLKDKLTETRQRATAMYLIDRLALRAGNEKGDEEADTVGCCSLRYEHITLEPPNTVHFDFLGKDSIRYENSVQVDPQVFKNLKLFKKQVGTGFSIFDRLTTSGLNKHLNSHMPGLSAKVFRTYNASFTCQQQLDKLTNPDDIIHDKILSFNRANREVAVLCNHQRAASKSHAQQMMKIGDKIRAIKYQRMKCRKQLFALDKSLKKKKPELAMDESDLEEDWIKEYEVEFIKKEREKVKNRFEKQNEKLKAENQAPQPKSELEAKLKKVDELEAQLTKERKSGKVDVAPSMTVEKLLAKIEKLDERINATKIQATDKEENKEISLGTSKMNYIDPRIIVAWCRKYDVPMEKVYSKTLVEKFRWAQNIPDDWKF
ncbi:uncharacterized protein BX664DRAFT_1002 [Halteromyces radiatus]|uniref:uncharacterized protein n=1 Tax=Halteromyces radiatus TaxID=101107 RepID=UPI00222004BE|nr:uncharacterized protein BX664DRAFT_1002 [Halteromyces radiatus]KAI8098492.1 hypothetical protein BX664DRAFT_1002 [Halteromyces radiatus]